MFGRSHQVVSQTYPYKGIYGKSVMGAHLHVISCNVQDHVTSSLEVKMASNVWMRQTIAVRDTSFYRFYFTKDF